MEEKRMDKDKLRSLVRETLQTIELYTEDAVELLMGTCAVESNLGQYRRQIGGGPALGIFQMEKNTYIDIWRNYLVYKKKLAEGVKALIMSDGDPEDCAEEMVTNDKLAIAMARVHYLRVRKPIPKASNLLGQGRYWKRWYNTPLGAGTVAKFMDKYTQYCV